MNNEKNIPILKQSTIKQHEVKQEPVNFSQLKREKLQAMDARKVMESDFAGIMEADRADLIDAVQVAIKQYGKLLDDSGHMMHHDGRVLILNKRSRLNDIYQKLNT